SMGPCGVGGRVSRHDLLPVLGTSIPFTGNGTTVDGLAPALEHCLALGLGLGQPARRRVERDSRTTDAPIQSLIGKQHFSLGYLRRETAPAPDRKSVV